MNDYNIFYIIVKNIFKKKSTVIINIIPKHNKNVQYKYSATEGTYLLDAISEANIKNINLFGICDKQLSCHTCAVDIMNKHNIIKKPTEEELDVLSELGSKYTPDITRMSCQIKLNSELDGLNVEIHDSAFIFDSDCN